MRASFAILLLAMAGSSGASAPTAVPVPAEFIEHDEFLALGISPDGEHYAATVPMEGRTALVVLRRSDLARTAFVVPEPDQHVTDFDWANDGQLVFQVAIQAGPFAVPQSTDYLYLLNADGSGSERIGNSRVGLVDTLPDDDEHILVTQWTAAGRAPVARMNLETGRTEVGYMKDSPLRSSRYLLDNANQVRFASGHAFNELTTQLHQRDDAGEWHLVNAEKDSGDEVYVAGFSADNRTAYFIIEHDELPDGFYAHDMATRERRLVYRHARVDIGRVLTSPLDNGVIALEFHDGRPSLQVVAPGDPYVNELQKVMRAFPGSYVTPTSYTRDGSTGIYLVSSDVNSGEFYRVDHASGEAVFLAARNRRLDPDQMAPMRAVDIRARDGLLLQAFVTVPRAAAGKPVPMVIIPHGGPKGVSDQWGFDRETQMLASRGYAVMQVNFRGSGNYGRRFREAGNGEWGGRMQDDLTDATRWALREGIAAPGRICLYGASYGAYAAMMGLAREPDLYACGIGNVGIYDLAHMYQVERRFREAKDYFDTALGDVDLDTISPVRLVRQIKAPVLLGAGELDYTAPVGQTRSMAAALRHVGVPVQMTVYDREAHGYYRIENRRDWAGRVLTFLDQHIGTGKAGDSGSIVPGTAAPAPTD